MTSAQLLHPANGKDKVTVDSSIDTHCGWCLRPAPADNAPDVAEWQAWVIGHWSAFVAVCPQCAPAVFGAARL